MIYNMIIIRRGKMGKKKLKVLLIEDNPGDARLIQEFLREKGSFELKWVEKLSDGIELLSKEDFDVIISDLSLPDSHGLETVDKISHFYPDNPIVVLTGNEDEEIALEAVKKGVQDYLVKGKIDSEILARSIKYAVERKKLEMDYRKQKKELEEIVDTLKTINDILKHDLSNILSTAEIALEGLSELESNDMIKIAVKSIKKSIDLIRQMRELEYLDSRDRNLKTYCLRSIIENVAKNYEFIHFSIDGDCRVLADEALSSVIDNIIGNAVIHGKTDRIDVIIRRNKDFCEIRIADYGRGIPEDVKNRIFEKGFRYGERGQSGLGLYIVKKVVEKYGGEITVEDNFPSGTVFVIRLKCSDLVIENEVA